VFDGSEVTDVEPPDPVRVSISDASGSDTTYREIFRIALRLARIASVDRDEAEDIAQQATIAVWERLADDPRGFDVSRPLVPFVLALVSNKAIDLLRHEKARGEPFHEYEQRRELQEEPEHDLEGLMNASELEDVIARTLEAMPPARREIWLRVRQDGLSYAEVASERDITFNTVDKQLKRAKQAMHRALALHTKEDR
jgi:RNA polymerase sigma-70 factor (ECF subfamily)